MKLGNPSANPRPAPPDPMAMYEQASRIGQACAHPKRLQVLVLLSQCERPVSELAALTGQSVATLSAHLQALKRASLVTSSRSGQQIFYRLQNDSAYQLVASLMGTSRELLLEARDLSRAYLEAPETVAELTPKALDEKLQNGRITLLDLRPESEYRAGHLPRAKSLPFAELENRLEELPRRRRLLAYCRGPYCLSAVASLQSAQRAGVSIKRLPFGVNEWKAAGLALETADTEAN